MSGVLEFAPGLNRTGLLRRARVVDVVQGENVLVALEGTTGHVSCQVLHTGSPGLTLAQGDVVLVWLQDEGGTTGVLLGRTGPYGGAAEPVVTPAEFAARPRTLVLEAQGDIVLRNGQAKLTLSEQGEVEIVCTSYTTRSHKLLRLLAPLIKLN